MIDPAEIDRVKRNIEAQLGDYERQLAEYAAFMDGWREKHDPARQRVKRFRDAAKSTQTGRPQPEHARDHNDGTTNG